MEIRSTILGLAVGLLTATASTAQVVPPVKISSTQGGFSGQLDDADGFGGSLANIGDLDRETNSGAILDLVSQSVYRLTTDGFERLGRMVLAR